MQDNLVKDIFWAIDQLNAGKKVTRKAWHFCKSAYRGQYISSNAKQYTEQDIKARDWILADDAFKEALDKQKAIRELEYANYTAKLEIEFTKIIEEL